MGKRTFFALALVASYAALPVCAAMAAAPNQFSANPSPSWTSKISSAFKSGKDKAVQMVTPKPEAPPDPLLSGRTPREANCELHVAMAQMQERNGKFPEAELEYHEALKTSPDHLGALLGLAHLYDRQGALDKAAKVYQKAISKHPKEAAPYNDLGLCNHRRGMLKPAAQSLTKAVELQPQKKLYRNNLAAVLIEMGQTDQALAHLTAAHGSATAHYNAGYLLTRKKDNAAALAQFQLALAEDPSLTAAANWIATLTHQPLNPGVRPSEPTVAQGNPQRRPVNRSIQPQREALPIIQLPTPQPSTAQILQGQPEETADPTAESEDSPRRSYPVQFPQRNEPLPAVSDGVPPTPEDLDQSGENESPIQLLPPVDPGS